MTLSLLEWGSIIFLVVANLYLYGTCFYYYMSKRGVKNSNTKIPFFGDFYQVLRNKQNLIQAIDNIYKTFPNERYVGFFEVLNEVIILKDTELIRQVCLEADQHFTDHRKIIRESDSLFEKQLISLQGQQWKQMRGLLDPVFKSKRMAALIPFGLKYTDYIISYLKSLIKSDGSIQDIALADMFSNSVNDIMASWSFGCETNSFIQKSFNNDWIPSKCESMQFINVISYWRKLKNILQFNTSIEKSRSFIYSVIKGNIDARMRNTCTNDTSDYDFIQYIVSTVRNSTSSGSSSTDTDMNIKDNLIAQAIGLYIGGCDTIATLLTFLFYELTQNIDVMTKLQREIDGARMDCNIIDLEKLNKLDYLDMVLFETLRKWPPMLATDKECTKPYTLPPPNDNSKTYTFLSKYALWIPIYSIHNDEKYFPDPETFNPDRFSKENKPSIKPFSFIPFGVGFRRCIGSEFAIIIAKLITYKLISQFEFVPVSKNPSKLFVDADGVLLKPPKDIRIGVKIRD